MGLRAVFAAALPKMMEAMGEAASFGPETGDAIPCVVFINHNVLLQPGSAEAQVWERGTTIEALLSEIGDEPERGETFTVDGILYTVQAILENDGLTVKAVVTK